jgi:hypothetical protein
VPVVDVRVLSAFSESCGLEMKREKWEGGVLRKGEAD